MTVLCMCCGVQLNFEGSTHAHILDAGLSSECSRSFITPDACFTLRHNSSTMALTALTASQPCWCRAHLRQPNKGSKAWLAMAAASVVAAKRSLLTVSGWSASPGKLCMSRRCECRACQVAACLLLFKSLVCTKRV